MWTGRPKAVSMTMLHAWREGKPRGAQVRSEAAAQTIRRLRPVSTSLWLPVRYP
jgi:hypothetical protein